MTRSGNHRPVCNGEAWRLLAPARRRTKPLGAGLHAARKAINEALARDHPDTFARIEPVVWQKPWVAQAQGAGRGRTALRYLAAYVKKSAFSERSLFSSDLYALCLERHTQT
jgi:Putative transposase